jgi:glycosyltransferase involved in cell wall biosynthesis
MKIKFILSHPVQYQSPFINFLVKRGLDIEVCYRTNLTNKKHYDPGFKKNIKWEFDLTKGHKHKYLNYIGPSTRGIFYPVTTDFYQNIFDDDTGVLVLHGNKIWYNILIIFLSVFYKKKIFLRDEPHFTSTYRTTAGIFLNKIFYYIMNSFVDVFLSIGKANTKYYLSNNINKNKIINVPYAIDNNFFSSKYKKKNKKKIFLTVAKFQHRKGYDILLQSIKLLHSKYLDKLNCEFWFVGDGETKKDCIKYVKKNRLTNVKFFPFQNQKQLKEYYKNADVFILPSRLEPWGLVINEAMASSNAIICSDVVGSSFDLVKNKINGFSFRTESYQDLAKKITFFLNEKNINIYQRNSYKIISKWGFEEGYLGFKKALKFIANK